MFEECVSALGEGTTILPEEKSQEIYELFPKSYPLTPWSRIDWEHVRLKMTIRNEIELTNFLSEKYGQIDEDEVFILWGYGDCPVLVTQLYKFINSMDDVLAVSSDVFILSPSKYVVEFHHDGEITIGYHN
ncbi:CDI toxin immunity protein [Paenibacillus anseongensis]|uniref:CDI toxin immunity protein n=1 Tax=Paenibacillus sp. CGMCC 1.16610 TaxID=2755557 RepID=UPI0015EEDC37|nr:hypothetical protein [Paenibacillus sp. CGMCC 1.16610]